MPYVTADTSLPRSLDVVISLSRAQSETRTDLTIMCVACEDLGLFPDSNRIRFYSTIEAVEEDFVAGTDAHNAATAFFAQSPRATTLAIGEVFLSDLPAELASAAFTTTELASIIAVSNGEMEITYDAGAGAVVESLTALDFSGAASLSDIAAVINAAMSSNLSCTVRTLPGGSERLSIKTDADGTGVSLLYPADGNHGGTYVGSLLNLTEAEGGKLLAGYSYVSIADELSSIQSAASANGEYIYGWALGSSLRDVTIQSAAAAWALPRKAYMVLVSNDLNALDASYVLDLASVVFDTDNKRVSLFYHDNPQRYPDVSILAYMLHVDYRARESTVTAKFKQLPGIETVDLTETEWNVLKEKGYNTYTAIGNSSRTYREGTSSSVGWFMDTVINLDNFQEDLEVNVYNVFLRNKKVPYTRKGQMLLVDACQDTGDQYVYNGTFADREEVDTTKKEGTSIIPAVQVIPTSVASASAAARAERIGPPIQMIVQEAGAQHSVSVSVEVVS
jgi:hypothetical protein